MPVLQPEKTKPKKKPQARGFHPDAMAQAQALNQQPDSIPAMMKPGEYVLPPDTVAAMGGPGALDATVAQTTPLPMPALSCPKGLSRACFSAAVAWPRTKSKIPSLSPRPTSIPRVAPARGLISMAGPLMRPSLPCLLRPIPKVASRWSRVPRRCLAIAKSCSSKGASDGMHRLQRVSQHRPSPRSRLDCQRPPPRLALRLL